jgi:hypothetical protein
VDNITIQLLTPDQYPLLEDFCLAEGIPMLSPEWSKVVAAIDTESGKIVGIMVVQMQLHCEPIWIKEGYRNGEISKQMADSLDGYLDGLAFSSGQPIGVWANPTNPASERIVRQREFVKVEKPVYTKVYDGSKLAEMLAMDSDMAV